MTRFTTDPRCRMKGETDPSLVASVTGALRDAGAVYLRALGSSMLPWLLSGDLLFIQRVEVPRVRPGEIVLFARQERLFVHRVIRKRRRDGQLLLMSKGDALPRADGPVSSAELLGRVVWIERGGRRIDLGSRRQLVLGRVLSSVSLSSRFWHPAARAAKRLLRAARRPPGQPPADVLPARET